jgi:hypothetical protein
MGMAAPPAETCQLATELRGARARAAPASPTSMMTPAAKVRRLWMSIVEKYIDTFLADVNACDENPCNDGSDTAVCSDVAAPAPGTARGRKCACKTRGFSYANDNEGCVGTYGSSLVSCNVFVEVSWASTLGSGFPLPCPAGGILVYADRIVLQMTMPALRSRAKTGRELHPAKTRPPLH